MWKCWKSEFRPKALWPASEWIDEIITRRVPKVNVFPIRMLDSDSENRGIPAKTCMDELIEGERIRSIKGSILETGWGLEIKVQSSWDGVKESTGERRKVQGVWK